MASRLKETLIRPFTVDAMISYHQLSQCHFLTFISLYFSKGYFFAFTLPKIYDMYRKQIDANIKQIKNKYDDCYKRWVIIKLAKSCTELEITVQFFYEGFL